MRIVYYMLFGQYVIDVMNVLGSQSHFGSHKGLPSEAVWIVPGTLDPSR